MNIKFINSGGTYMKKIFIAATLLGVITLTGCSAKSELSQADTSTQGNKFVNVYSARNYDVDKDIFLEFEEETGIKVNLIEGKGDELTERMNREKGNPQADLFITVGGETIAYAKEQDLLQVHGIDNLDDLLDKKFYGEDWVALTKRARILVYDKTKNPDFKLQSYFDLGQERYEKSILVRSGSSSYNIALVANILQNQGAEKARDLVAGIVNNLAREPQGNDRDQAKGVIAGEGEVGIINTYYQLKMLTSADASEVEVANLIGVAFPEESHVNISWGGIVKGAKNTENAKKLLEYLLEEKQQKTYMEENGEYPINNKVVLSDLLTSLGELKQMPVDYETLGNFTTEAIMLMDELGWK
ncbi:MAG: extracellular solute-binding protein [Anaerolineaceae bacterium]|nr:MAG: extracellular solute-binding protein [Anaerolineaceae bacterium]